MMNGVGGNREYGALWEVMIANRDARAWRYDAWKAERGGRVNTKGFVDYLVKTERC